MESNVYNGKFNGNIMIVGRTECGKTFGKKTVCDRLIIMDDVSGLADESKKFAAFLTVTIKYNYNCVYIFHTVFPEKSSWKLMLSQTNILNIFAASVPINSIRKILEGACSRKTKKYIPQNTKYFFGLIDFSLFWQIRTTRSV